MPTPPSSPITILSTRAVRGVLTAIAPRFEAEHGLTFRVEYGATNELLPRIAAGVRADLVVLTGEAIDGLIAAGMLEAGSRVDLARSSVGIAVKAGAAKPDIGSADALRRTLLGARSIGYAKSGASGLHFAKVIARLGIADAVNRKATIRDGFVGEMAAHGEVELAVQQVSELMVVPGVDLLGPLPDELQETMVFSSGLFVSAPHAVEAGRLTAYLRRPETARLVVASGLTPV